MLLYLMPFFVILLVVAVVLKNREGKSANDDTDSAKSKTKSKTAPESKGSKSKLGAKPRKSRDSKENTEDDVVHHSVATKSTAVAPELLQKLQQLIHGGHYSTAEAHINQALNRDASQHELYLTLLKVHLLQKDELAINQLINHIRSLNAPELLAEAEAKRHEHEQLQSIENDFLTETTDTPAPSKSTGNNPFEALQLQRAQSNNTANTSVAPAETNDSAAFDFSDFNFSAKTEPAAPAIETETDFNFTNSGSLEPNVAAQSLDLNPTNAVADAESTAVTSDDFNFSFQTDSVADLPADIHSPATATDTPSAQPIDADFNFNSPISTATAFNFNAAEAPSTTSATAAEPEAATTATHDLAFDLSNLSLAEPQTTSPIANNQAASIDFDLSQFSFGLEQPTANTASEPESSTSDITALDVAATTTADLSASGLSAAPLEFHSATEPQNVALDFNLDVPAANLPSSASTELNQTAPDANLQVQQHSDDALLQQFPELRKLNSSQLDIDLAALYTDYAAADAAHNLLDSVAHQTLSPDQKQQLQVLQQRLQSTSH